jgi:hypothetical protein
MTVNFFLFLVIRLLLKLVGPFGGLGIDKL